MDIMDYIKPELIVLAVVLYFIGIWIKNAESIKDKNIPWILGVLGIFLCGIWVFANSQIGTVQEILMAIFTAIVQGVLVAGASNYVNQLIKQAGKTE